MLVFATLLALSTAFAAATNFLVADYSGTITTIALTESGGKYSASATFTNNGCAPNPSWLTIDANRGLLFCLNEGLTSPNGSLSSFTINDDGSLVHIRNVTALSGPVNGAIYGHAAGQRGLAVAHYGGSGVSSWLLDGFGTFEPNQQLTYTLATPGPVADRQAAPHEHEAIRDPTGQYILVPDLGADLVRVYSWDNTTLMLRELDPLKAAPGSGPRHGAFWNPHSIACESCTTYFYIANELAATVTGYVVTYKPNGGGMSFTQVYTNSTLGIPKAPAGMVYPSEIFVTPDNKYLVVSNRNDSSQSFKQADGTTIQSDSIATFELKPKGALKFRQLAAAGGSYPRHTSMNNAGTLVAVGLQNDNAVVILSRDSSIGLIGDPVARIPLSGNVTCVVWDEQRTLGAYGQ